MAEAPVTQAQLSAQIQIVREEIGVAVMARFSELKTRVDAMFGEVSAARQQTSNTEQQRIAAALATLEQEVGGTITQEQLRVGTALQEMEAKIGAVQEGRLNEVATKIVHMEGNRQQFQESVATMFQAEQRLVRNESETVRAKIESIERRLADGLPDQHYIGEGEGQSGPRVRVPDPAGWKLDTLEPKQGGFVKWRESFDLQVGSVWMGLDSYLEALHIEKDKVNKDHYESFMLDFNYPAGRNMADWDHAFLSRKLYMLIHHYAGADARKVITTSFSKCGFEILPPLVDGVRPDDGRHGGKFV